MPRFDKSAGGRRDDGDGENLVVPEAWLEPRCHVCQSKYRTAIDRMIALGTNYSEISRNFGGEIDRKSISSHAKKHLNYQEAAIRQIIERETRRASEDLEIGISGQTKRRVYLETVLQKGMEQMVGDSVSVEVRDAMAAIEALERQDKLTDGAQLDEIKIQFQAILQAIKEVAAYREDISLGAEILTRAREIVGIDPPATLSA